MPIIPDMSSSDGMKCSCSIRAINKRTAADDDYTDENSNKTKTILISTQDKADFYKKRGGMIRLNQKRKQTTTLNSN